MAKRPLIFIEPLSESLAKLKEVITPVADAENIEIMIAPNLSEAMQLVSTIGASLTLMSEAKKTALLLKTHGKRMIKQSSKVMLLTKQRIPQKSLEKMMKYGLSECIVEPIQPKTLLYKVKLLLRSLPQEDKKSKEFSLKSIEGGQKEQGNDLDVTVTGDEAKNPTEDKAIKETKKADVIAKENPMLEGDVEDGQTENELDSHYEGNVSKEKEDAEGYYEGEKNKEKNLESHYKGEVTERESDLGEDEPAKDRPKNDNIIDDLLKGKLANSTLDLEQDEETYDAKRAEEYEAEKKRKTGDINLEFEDEIGDEQSIEKDDENDDKYLKGKLRKKEETEEEEELEIEEVGDLNPAQEKLRADLKIEKEDDEGPSILDKKSPAQEEGQKNKKTDLTKDDDLAIEDVGDLRELKAKNPEANPEKDSPNEGEVEHIDKYYRSDELSKEESKDGNMKSSDSTDMNLNLEDDNSVDAIRPDELADIKSKKSTNMDLGLEQDENEKMMAQTPEDGSEMYKKAQKALDENANYSPEELRKKLLEEKAELERRNRESEEKDQNSGNKKTLERGESETLEDYKKRTSEQNFDENDKKTKEWQSREEEIRKQASRETRKDVEMGNWEKLSAEKTEEMGEFPTSRHEKELIITKKDLGEQTIDYSFLKKEFETIEKYGRDAVKNAYRIEETGGSGASYNSKVKGAVPYSVEISETIIEEGPKEVKEETNTVFYPDSKGLEFAVMTLNFIEDKNLKEEEINNNISQILLQEYLGHSVFFRLNTETQNIDTLHKTDTDFIRQQFETYKHLYFEMWKGMTLPYWSDETFQAKEIFFIYPYFEGTKSMGFSICFFPLGIKQEKAPRVEVLLECLRTMYLDYSHGNSNRGSYNAIQNKKEEAPPISKLFGKIGSWFKKTG